MIYLNKSNQFHVIKMASKKARLSETERFINSGMKKKVFGTFYRTIIRSGKKREKVLGECRQN